MDSIRAIERFRNGDKGLLKDEVWLRLLALTSERSVNLERLYSLDGPARNYVLDYVKRTLQILSGSGLREDLRLLLEEVLKWSETAKTGMPHHRKAWMAKGYNLFAHNIGSARIYLELSQETDPGKRRIISTLIQTHGLLGQTLRGEVPLEESKPLHALVESGLLTAQDLRLLLKTLNRCVIQAVDSSLWEAIQPDISKLIEAVCFNDFDACRFTLKERLKRLRSVSIRNGEDFEAQFTRFFGEGLEAQPGRLSKEDVEIRESLISGDSVWQPLLEDFLDNKSLWYVEAALFDFSFEEFLKIFLLLATSIDEGVRHISFEKIMQEIYYQHEGRKRINIYKKRILEKYLSNLTFEAILSGHFPENIHVTRRISMIPGLPDTAFLTFDFSPASRCLIDFCTESEKSDVLYEKAVVLLFDLFGLRKDAYDRFYQEENYLTTMNQAIDYKKIILDYITGSRVLDIGPGGGALMDLICERYPDKQVLGVDISSNVIDALRKKKQLENRPWEVLFGDALDLSKTISKGSVDTIIFCSVLHELFSYIPFEGRKFNPDTLRAALKSAFDILSPGGRIIIRDGIMTEPGDQMRIIRFLSEEGMTFLKNYQADFKGRDITYGVVGHNEVKMPVNDAMEFLYTYTWGEKSYVHEVQEQFGYLTPSGFRDMIAALFGAEARILELRHFLQEGYTLALSQKIQLMDGERRPVRLPDSTCLVVIEKAIP